MEPALNNEIVVHAKNLKEQKIVNMANININGKDEKGRTSLLRACEEGLVNLAMDLIRKGADVNEKDNNGRTPLMVALEKGNDSLAIALVNNGAHIQALIQSNLLTSQFFKSHPEFVKFLSANGASGNSLSNNAILIATSETAGTAFLDAYVQSGGYINAADHTGKTCLMTFAENKNMESLISAVDNYGADVNQRDNKGRTAIMYAARKGNIKAIDELHKRDGDIAAQDEKGYNALMHAVECQEEKTVEYMLKTYFNEFDLNAKTNDGETAIMLAAKSGNHKIVKTIKDAEEQKRQTEKTVEGLLQNFKSIDINAQDNDGNTALMHCCKSNSTECFKLLLKHQTDIFKKNNDGLSVIDIIHIQGNEEFKSALEETMPQTNPAAYKLYSMRKKMGTYDNYPPEMRNLLKNNASERTDKISPQANNRQDFNL